MHMKCDTCKFWDQENVVTSAGLCRRYGPRPAERPPLEKPEVMDVGWPMTTGEDWCGEWEAKIEMQE
jgi:hypothetical protein